MSNLISIRAHRERKIEPRKFEKGVRLSRYNGARSCTESIVVEADCLVDVVLSWNANNDSWEREEVKWETARPVPPKPPGLFKRAFLWVKARFTKNTLPTARLLKD